MPDRLLRVGAFVRLLALVLAAAAPLSAQIVFGPAQSTALPPATSGHFAVGDVNGDTWADLVVGNELQPGVRFGDGAGHFGPETVLAVTGVGSAVALADLTGDDVLDLVCGRSRDGIAHVSRGLGDGSFEALAAYPLGVVMTDSVNHLEFAIGDLDQDGDSDLLAITKGGPLVSGGEARLFRNTGTGTLLVAQVLVPSLGGAPFPRYTGGRFASLNGDGFTDLVLDLAWDISPIFISRGYAGGPGYSFTPLIDMPQQIPVAFDDFDGNGTVDLLTRGAGSPAGTDNDEQLTWVSGQGDGTFPFGVATVLPNGVVPVGASRLDDDNLLDVAVIDKLTGDAWFLHGNGDGTFEQPTAHVSLSVLQATGATLLADCDADGRLDLVAEVGVGTSAPAAVVSLNRSYPASSPLLDLGHQLKGSQWPILVVTGSFVAGQPFAFKLSGAPASGVAYLVVGFAQLNAPFKGGTMVPLIWLVTGPWAVSPSGNANIAGVWPTTPAGFPLVFQFWTPDVAGPAGLASSSGVLLTTP